MNKITKRGQHQLVTPEKIERVERAMLQLPQVECPVVHRFGPGLYIREVFIPSGTFSVGHYQKQEHMNILLKGRVTMLNDDGSTIERVAPFIYVGKPGRKIGYIHEDMVWQNIYATTETDVEKLEAILLIKSDSWMENQNSKDRMDFIAHQVSRDDYRKLLVERGVTEAQARAQSENESDQIPLPHGGYKIMVAASPIEGKGLFATAAFAAGEIIAPARIGGKRTIAGRFTNHSIAPNAKMMALHNNDINLVATRPIKGCHGGNTGEEVTVDYRQALNAAIKASERRTLCLQ